MVTLPVLEPAVRFAPELVRRAQGLHSDGLRAAIFDVDGVLTDGRLYFGESGEALKVFHSLDGHGLKQLVQVGIEPVIITGRDSPALRRRIAELGLTHAFYGIHDKLQVAQTLLGKQGWVWGQVAVMGDDWPDLPLMVRAALAVAPANAHPEVKAVAHHVSGLQGGAGAARECCDLLLMGAGKYAGLLAGHLATLDRHHG